MSSLIEPRTLKGFRDYPPDLMIPREQLMETARRVFRSYGYPPIDTPALEYAEILLGKMDAGAEMQRQIYRFKDHGQRDVALRFDLTVPFARFAAQHIGKLGTPFKRYHIGPVWRGENTQAGRYREFYQCDFDIIGTTSTAADIEIALVIHDLMVALGFARFEIRLNNRLLLNGLLEAWGLAERSADLLRVLDKLGKQGPDAVKAEILSLGILKDIITADKMIEVVRRQGTNDEILDFVAAQWDDNPKVLDGVAKLRELLNVSLQAGVPSERLRIDLGISRGLDYYTGMIYETFLSDLPKIGSVCSGGRYDDLAGLYTKQKLPGVGASLGLDRLLAAMEELHLLPRTGTPAQVLIAQFASEHLGAYEKIGRELRSAGIGTEVFPESKKLGQQLQYAETKGFPLALIAGPDELSRGECKLKVLARREEIAVPLSEVVGKINEVLSRE
jgi:histidyl-tRNA synthetase